MALKCCGSGTFAEGGVSVIGSKTHVTPHPLVEPKNKLPAAKWRAHSTFYFSAERLLDLLVF